MALFNSMDFIKGFVGGLLGLGEGLADAEDKSKFESIASAIDIELEIISIKQQLANLKHKQAIQKLAAGTIDFEEMDLIKAKIAQD